jgi:ubiquinone/menaquinone biosynthesis C-methylase UbiE
MKNMVFRGDTKGKWKIGANAFTHNRQRNCVSNLISIAENDRPINQVLDCPCGSGRMVDLLLPRNVTCADANISRLKDVKDNFGDAVVVAKECDVFDLPFEDNSFDLILNCLLIQHITKGSLHSLFSELRRVTNRWLLVTYPSKQALANIVHKREKTLLTEVEFRELIAATGLEERARHRVLPYITNCHIVLLEKV